MQKFLEKIVSKLAEKHDGNVSRITIDINKMGFPHEEPFVRKLLQESGFYRRARTNEGSKGYTCSTQKRYGRKPDRRKYELSSSPDIIS